MVVHASCAISSTGWWMTERKGRSAVIHTLSSNVSSEMESGIRRPADQTARRAPMANMCVEVKTAEGR